MVTGSSEGQLMVGNGGTTRLVPVSYEALRTFVARFQGGMEQLLLS